MNKLIYTLLILVHGYVPSCSHAATLCEIKDKITLQKLGEYVAEKCDISRYGGKFGDSERVIHQKNDVAYQEQQDKERADSDAAIIKEARRRQAFDRIKQLCLSEPDGKIKIICDFLVEL